MLTDPDYGVHYSRTPPEELLIFSILSRAILDLFGSVGLTSNDDEAMVARHDALVFLTQMTGGWARRRTELCDAVGINGDDMRDRVVRVLEGDAMALDTYETRGGLTNVSDARELWEHEKGAVERARQASLAAKARRKPVQIRPRPQSTIFKYSEVRPIVLALLDQPRSFKDLILATNGDVSDSTIRDVLRIAVAKGEVVNDSNTYVLASLPEMAVAAATG